MRYSLHSVGLPSQGGLMFSQAVHRQLRLITRSPAHLWHVTSEDILHRVKVKHPWASLCEQFQAMPSRSALLLQTSGITEWITRLSSTFEDSQNPTACGCLWTIRCTSPMAQTGEALAISQVDRRVHSFRQLSCQACGQSFDSLGALRRHEAHTTNRSLRSLQHQLRQVAPPPPQQCIHLHAPKPQRRASSTLFRCMGTIHS